MKYKYQTASINFSILEEFAQKHRKNPTDAERILWNFLKGGKLGYHFRRQHIILDFIPDFVCLSKQLIIEIDGGYHFEGEQPLLDADRTKVLLEQVFKVLRFTNEEVIGNIESVIRTITKELKENE